MILLYILYVKANLWQKTAHEAKIQGGNKLNKLMQKVKNKKGFTLIELIVVIAILGILVLLAAPRFLGYTKDANVATMKADAKVLSNSALIYNIETDGNWPTANDTVIATIKQGTEEINLVAIDENKLSEHIQSLKGKVSDYGIVKDKGSREGSVYHIGSESDLSEAGVVNRKGDKHFGVDLVDVALDADDNVSVVTP